MALHDAGSAAQRYALFETERTPFLHRGRDCARLTIPTLMPPEGNSAATNYPTPYQAIGARGVNHLASKLLLAVFPANAPFFRLTIDDIDLAELAGPAARGKVEDALARIERSGMQEIEGNAVRVPAFEAIKQLLVVGNVLLYYPKEGGMRVFRLDRYVVKRDAMGSVLEILTKESVSPLMLPKEVQALLAAKNPNSDTTHDHKNIDLFTHIYRSGKKWLVYQEIEGIKIPGSDGSFPEDKLPWIPLRMIRVDGESYGRSYVEEYLGDLQSLESLMKAIVQGSAAAARVLFLVKPNGTTKLRTVAEAPNGSINTGNAEDVTVLQVQKSADFRVAQETVAMITERLSFAFLLNSAVQRSGERVTAEEIRYMAQELESALGGVYSILSQELQLPVVKLILHRMEQAGKMPKFPKDTLKPQIVTGMEALGRGQDLNKLQQFLAILQPLGPEYISQSVNLDDFADRAAASLGIDTNGLIKTPEMKAQEQQQMQQKQQAAMMQQTMSGMAEKAAPKLAEGAMMNPEALQGMMNGDE